MAKAPAPLSGGMINRVALTRALALDPEILFLDEPTSGLDPVSASAFDQLIHTLRDALRLTVFHVTRSRTLCAICDRVAMLSPQRVIAVGPLLGVANCDDRWIGEYFRGPVAKLHWPRCRNRARALRSKRERITC
ncbi:ABC transporter ATP-binding protein [Caballeronia choica]|jgi:phospholipid/cholesterol/gamma-HCH transport system ATP-binding protein|uniref:ABC transporter ATP-binding protein n=1 Tax=Caballeronia choica TaxID=326476 RepID=A0A158L1E1_9BURK|nr:ATP-binding cassette domain-containing protein [Caballeronia choica]SAL86471.1 ABC transporter ATP-binding protein [Caballeronia choica]